MNISFDNMEYFQVDLLEIKTKLVVAVFGYEINLLECKGSGKEKFVGKTFRQTFLEWTFPHFKIIFPNFFNILNVTFIVDLKPEMGEDRKGAEGICY